MVINSIFKKPLHRKETKAYYGYDYHGNVLKNTMSRQMFDNNKTLADFVMKIDGVVCSMIDATKAVHMFNMISLDKNDRRKN